MYGEWSVKHAYTQTFLAHCALQVQNKKKSQESGQVSKEPAKFFLVLYVT